MRVVYTTPNMSTMPSVEPFGVITRELFPDGTPNIYIENLEKIINYPSKIGIFYYTQYENMEQKKIEEYIIHVLADTVNVASLTIIDLFDPLATMERVDAGREGCVSTANVDAHFWKTLPIPEGGEKIRRILFDHHTLHNRFYYSGGNTTVKFLSAMPLIEDKVLSQSPLGTWTVAFPDEGAYKRFGGYFTQKHYKTIICGKVRKGDQRIVTINDSEVDITKCQNIMIVDDLVRSGGTLLECAKVLREAGSSYLKVSVFVTHAQFPNDSWKKFVENDLVDMFYTTNTIPRVAVKLLEYPDKFTVLEVNRKIDSSL